MDKKPVAIWKVILTCVISLAIIHVCIEFEDSVAKTNEKRYQEYKPRVDICTTSRWREGAGCYYRLSEPNHFINR